MCVDTPIDAMRPAVEDLYLVFRRYGLKSRLEACPCCTTDADQALIRSRSLRALTAEDLQHYVFSAISTWGDEDDFRHFLPRVLELAMTNNSLSFVAPELILDKLAYAGWGAWPAAEQEAVESFLRLRWSIGLTQETRSSQGDSVSEFDADEWLCGIALTGLDTLPYVDVWLRMGAVSTFGHVVAFLESNRHLLTDGRVDNAWWGDTREAPREAPAYAEPMRTWLSSLLDDPGFQTRLAAWYQQ